MNIVTLHRDRDRREYYGATPQRPIRYEKSINCWFVTDPDDARTLLQSRHLCIADYDEIYRRIEEHSGRSFADLRFAFAHIPLCSNGSRHRTLRRRHAEYLIARRAAVQPAIPALVERHVAPLLRAGEIDLMPQCIGPLVADFIAVLTETDFIEDSAAKRTNTIFDSLIGLRKRLELNDEIGDIRRALRSGYPNLSEDDEGLRLALFILGRDALIGTLGESLHWILTRNPARRLSQIDYPTVPCETGVPFVERLIAVPFEHGDIKFSQNERVRISLQSFAYSDDPTDHVRMFGVGAHACLGRQLALEVWHELTNRLAKIRTRAELVSHAMQTDDFMFTVPRQLLVRLTA